jgi:pimeloyl-ACP methyl ester carboxylesterase
LVRGVIKERRSLVNGLLLLCPIAIHETQRVNRPAWQVLERDEPLLDSLSADDRKYFEVLAVLQNRMVWGRIKDDVLPGYRIVNDLAMGKKPSRHGPFSVNVDQIEEPYMQPTLMIMGRQDCAVGYRDHWQLIESYPRASFVILDKAGHNLQIEQDILFNELVKEWLNRVLEESG